MGAIVEFPSNGSTAQGFVALAPRALSPAQPGV